MKILIPTLLGMVSSIIMIITDGIFVGRYAGSNALAAVNISVPLFSISTGFALMFGVGCSIVAATHLSRGNIKAANINITQTFAVSISLFTILSLFVGLFCTEVSKLLGSTEELLPLVVIYISILAPSLVFFMIQNLGLFIIRLDGSPKFAMSCSLIPATTNIIGDFVLIGVYDMGIKGAILATAGSYVVGGLMVLIYMFKFSKTLKLYRLKLSKKSLLLTVRNIAYICKLGFSGFLGEFAIAIMVFVGNFAFLSYIGEDGVAAFSIACYYFPIIFMINNAIAQSAQPIINYNLILRKDRADATMSLALKVAILSGTIISLGMIFLAPQMVGLFLDKSYNAYEIAVTGIPYFALGFVFFAVNMLYVGYYQSVSKVKRATTLTLLRGYIFLVIGFLLLPKFFGVLGIWLTVPISEALTCLILVLSIWRDKRRVEA